jgi:hypothetical protein
MRKEHIEAEGRFYATVAEMLGTSYDYKPWTGRPPNRWNNRHPGNGRFPGYGTIKMFSPTSIHVCLRAPVPINRMCRSEDEVYDLLRPPSAA